MSTQQTDRNVREPATRRLKTRPTASAVLWGHLLSSTDTSQTTISNRCSQGPLGSSSFGITPTDKNGASLRILLHDTQANLEKFSDRVTKLTGGIDESKREIHLVRELLQSDHEKLVEEMVDLVNRCQTEITRVIGSPSQVSHIDNMRVEVAKVDTRLTALENKVDMLQVLSQAQLQALQTVQDQQGQIITAISPVLPLLQAIPLYIDNSRRELLDGLRDLRSLYPAGKPHSSTPKPPTEPVIPQRPCGPLSSSSSPTDQNEDRGRHKKRKLGVENGTSRILVSPAFHGDATTISSHSLRPVAATERSPPDMRLAANGTTPHRFVSGPSPASPDISARLDRLKRTAFQTPHRQPFVDLLRPNVTPRISDSALPPAAKSGVSGQVTGHASASGPAAARTAMAPLRSQKPGVGAARTAPKPLPPVQGTPKNADSLASTTSTLSQKSVAQTEHTRPPSVVDPSGMRASKAHTSPAMLRREFQGQNNTSAIKLADARHTTPYDDIPSTPIRRNFQPPLSVLKSAPYPPTAGPSANPPGTTLGKPISIKDVKALAATPAFRKEQKRFIPLDDDDDDDLME